MSLLRSIIKESLSARVKILGNDELRDHIYGFYEDGNEEEYKRFSPSRPGKSASDVFKYFAKSDLTRDSIQVFPCVFIGDKIVGMAKLQKSPHDDEIKENIWWISFISVDPKYQGMGYSRLLVDALFKYAKDHDIVVQGSSRTKMGQERLGHLIDQYSKKYGVEYIPSEGRFYE